MTTRCGCRAFAFGCAARGASWVGTVLADAGCSGSAGSSTSGCGGNGLGADTMPDDSAGLASLATGGDTDGAAGAGTGSGAETGCLIASATGAGAGAGAGDGAATVDADGAGGVAGIGAGRSPLASVSRSTRSGE